MVTNRMRRVRFVRFQLFGKIGGHFGVFQSHVGDGREAFERTTTGVSEVEGYPSISDAPVRFKSPILSRFWILQQLVDLTRFDTI
jgi:hypothetical protein